MGACTDWYSHVQAAKYYNVPPWELAEAGLWWKDIAIKCINAEAQARKSLEQTGK